MAQVIKDYQGQIVTIEYDEQVAQQARLNFERAGVADCIELWLGDAREIVPKLSGEFDLVFLDVDKRLYAPLLADCIRLLRSERLVWTRWPGLNILEQAACLAPIGRLVLGHGERFNVAVFEDAETLRYRDKTTQHRATVS